MTNLLLTRVVTLILVCLRTGMCLRCYECTEVTNPECVKPIKNIPTFHCMQASDVCVVHKTPAAVLPVEEYSVNMTMRVIRGCKFKEYCEYVKDFSGNCSTCATDFCNSSSIGVPYFILVNCLYLILISCNL